MSRPRHEDTQERELLDKLCEAIEKNNIRAVSDLLDAGAPVNSKKHKHLSQIFPLGYAVQETINLEIVRLLISRGADINLGKKDHLIDYSALYMAIESFFDSKNFSNRDEAKLICAFLLILGAEIDNKIIRLLSDTKKLERYRSDPDETRNKQQNFKSITNVILCELMWRTQTEQLNKLLQIADFPEPTQFADYLKLHEKIYHWARKFSPAQFEAFNNILDRLKSNSLISKSTVDEFKSIAEMHVQHDAAYKPYSKAPNNFNNDIARDTKRELLDRVESMEKQIAHQNEQIERQALELKELKRQVALLLSLQNANTPDNHPKRIGFLK